MSQGTKSLLIGREELTPMTVRVALGEGAPLGRYRFREFVNAPREVLLSSVSGQPSRWHMQKKRSADGA
jgi:hypothetical protein